MKLKKFLFLLMVMVLVSGCGVQNDSSYVRNEDQHGRQFVDNDLDREEIDERQLETVRNNTNQNPNFLDLSDSQPTNGTDINKAREVVEYYTDYEADEVWINGKQMWVTAHTRKEMTPAERDREEAKLHKRLVKAIPRYKIEVQIKER